MKATRRRTTLWGLLVVGVALLLVWLFLEPILRRLPDPLYALFVGRPAVSPDVAFLIDAGAGLNASYRQKWLAARSVDVDPERARRLCAAPGGRCDFFSLAAALEALEHGDVLLIGPGVYEEAGELDADSVRIVAETGAHVRGHAAGGKGALVIRGDDTVIEGLECSDIAVSDGNGACVRLEGRNLTLKGVYFHDAQEGVLTGTDSGLVLIEDSLLERLGEGGQAHAIYMGSGTDSLRSKGEGHGIKSRAARTVIEDCVVASLDGEDSRLIDLPNGGVNTIRGNVLENGPNSSNADMIAIGLELDQPSSDPALNQSTIVANVMILDRHYNVLLHIKNVPRATFMNNVIVGGSHRAVDEGNYWFLDRRAAGLADYPALFD